MQPLKTLLDYSSPPTAVLPETLRHLYGGDLSFPQSPAGRPYVVGNFVSTLDGVVSYKIPGNSGGAAISGADDGDRFIMGLLRASVDAVMIAAGTLHDVSREHLWVPAYIYPEAKDFYAQYRGSVLHKPEQPLVVIVSGSGRIDLGRAIFHTPQIAVVVLTTAGGEDHLARATATELKSVVVRSLESSDTVISPDVILRILYSEFGVRRLLHEGGPTFFGNFLAHHLVDELFMTVAPQIAGRGARTVRPGMISGVEFLPDTAPWFRLLSAKEKGDRLYLRYRAG